MDNRMAQIVMIQGDAARYVTDRGQREPGQTKADGGEM
jgi:hypothetical protein